MVKIIVGIITVALLIVLFYYIYRKMKDKSVTKKDYNRKISKEDIKLRNDLEILRAELRKSDDPAVNNEILNKIQAIINNRKG